MGPGASKDVYFKPLDNYIYDINKTITSPTEYQSIKTEIKETTSNSIKITVTSTSGSGDPSEVEYTVYLNTTIITENPIAEETETNVQNSLQYLYSEVNKSTRSIQNIKNTIMNTEFIQTIQFKPIESNVLVPDNNMERIAFDIKLSVDSYKFDQIKSIDKEDIIVYGGNGQITPCKSISVSNNILTISLSDYTFLKGTSYKIKINKTKAFKTSIGIVDTLQTCFQELEHPAVTITIKKATN